MHGDLNYLKKEGRKAKINIALELLFNSETRAFLGQCVIVHATVDLCSDTMEYLVYHPDLPKEGGYAYPKRYQVWLTSEGKAEFLPFPTDAPSDWRCLSR